MICKKYPNETLNRKTKILKVIQANPGIHVRGIIKESSFENGVVLHYLRQLEKDGVVRTQKRARYHRYYPVDIEEKEFPVIRNMRKPTKKEILFRIMVEGNPSFKDLTLKIDKSPSTISWNVSELVKEGVVERCKKDGKQCYRVKDKELFKKTFQKEFSKLFNEKLEHSEDIFLAL